MKKIIRVIFMVLALGLLLSLAVGCAQEEQAAEGELGGRIVLQASTAWIFDTDRELAAMFTERTGVEVDFQTFPDDQYETLIRVMVATQEAGDLIWIRSGTPMRDFFPEENFVDMSDFDFVAKMDDYARNSVTIDDRVFAFPTITPGGWAILYHRDIFEELNLTVPTNFEELVAVCEVLLANDITPIHMWGAGIWHFGKWFYGVTPAAYIEVPNLFERLNTNDISFADINTFEVFLEQFKVLAESGFFGDTFMSDTWERAFEQFGSGRFAMALLDPSMVPEIINQNPGQTPENFGAFPVVLAGNRQFAANTGGPALMLSRHANNMDAAVAYINFLGEDEQLNFYFQNHPTRSVPVFHGITGRPSPTADDAIANSVGGVGLALEGNMLFDNEVEIHRWIQDFLLGGRTARDVLVSFDEYRQPFFDALG